MSDKNFVTVSRKIGLRDYIIYLQYHLNVQDITVETKDAAFSVWDNGTLRVGGEEFTTDEFYSMIASEWKLATCNNVAFEWTGKEFMSVEPVDIIEERFDQFIEI